MPGIVSCDHGRAGINRRIIAEARTESSGVCAPFERQYGKAENVKMFSHLWPSTAVSEGAKRRAQQGVLIKM